MLGCTPSLHYIPVSFDCFFQFCFAFIRFICAYEYMRVSVCMCMSLSVEVSAALELQL